MNLRIYLLFRTLLNIALTLLTFFLVARVLLLLFSANSSTPVVSWIFSLSSFLIAPFANIVPNINTPSGVLDMVALITLLAYLIAGYLLLNIVEWITGARLAEEEYPPVVHYHDLSFKKKGRP